MTEDQRNKKILKAIAEQTARATASKETARQMLIEEGIYTTDGALRPEFGGEHHQKQK